MTRPGLSPASSRATRNAAVEAATSAGWQIWVSVSRSTGPSKQISESA